MTAPSKLFVVLGALSLAIVTIAAALSSHALDGVLDERALRSFETAVRLQFYHGLGLLLLPPLAARIGAPRALTLAGWLFVAGTVLFCGTIYATALGAPAWLGRAAPFGGTSFIAGWIVLAVGAARAR